MLMAVASTLLWPQPTGSPHPLRTALAAGSTIEILQWTLSRGRVVSPVDAVLNAVGATAAGCSHEGSSATTAWVSVLVASLP